MHMLVGVVLHVTVLAIIGYLLLWTASKAQGVVAFIGWLLGLWVFVLAILSVVAVVAAPIFGGKPFGMEMMRGHDGWMHDGYGGDESSRGPGQPSRPNPAPARP
jgi:hypothetical protein